MVGATVVDIENLIERIGDTKPLENVYVVSVYKSPTASMLEGGAAGWWR